MGIHPCNQCQQNGTMESNSFRYSTISTGDVTIWFLTPTHQIHGWKMPDMIKHYIADHGWKPPNEFLNDVEHGNPVTEATAFDFMKAEVVPVDIGYLQPNEIPSVRMQVSENWFAKLLRFMADAEDNNQRAQSKDLGLY